jgi:L-seryl-tRNA(Ser) seleniumtransferase
MTVLGGSLMAPEVVAVMDRAAQGFVDMFELMDWAGRQIAELTGAEAGLVTTGTAGAMLLSAAACLTGPDRARMARLPDTADMPNEIVVQHVHRISFDHALRTAGARLVEVGAEQGATAEELEAALGPRTAAVFYVELHPRPSLSLEQVVEIAHRHGLPVIVDAAAELPPVDNLHAFLQRGADLVLFSGRKQISGPNDSGILCGRRDLVEAAAAQAFPNNGIGRPLKVGKEQIVGLVFALRRFVALDHTAEMERWESMARTMAARLQGLTSVQAEVAYPGSGARPLVIPRTRVMLDPRGAVPDVRAAVVELRQGHPAIAVSAEPRAHLLWLNPQHLLDGEERVVADRVREVLAVG